MNRSEKELVWEELQESMVSTAAGWEEGALQRWTEPKAVLTREPGGDFNHPETGKSFPRGEAGAGALQGVNPLSLKSYCVPL